MGGLLHAELPGADDIHKIRMIVQLLQSQIVNIHGHRHKYRRGVNDSRRTAIYRESAGVAGNASFLLHSIVLLYVE